MDIVKKFPEEVVFILSDLEADGYKAYVVGGAIRDLLLQKVPKDWDIVTDAPMEVILTLFPKAKEVGKSFGVALVTINGKSFEIARFRQDGKYSDNRHPDKVIFCDTIEKDLERRDFTINAIAYDLRGNSYCVDNSFQDLENRLIRTVGNPQERFFEDPLRMLRAVRFAAQTGFDIEFATFTAISRYKEAVLLVSPERIQEELNKILLLENNEAYDGIECLENSGLLFCIIPELRHGKFTKQNKWHIHDVWEHSLATLSFTPLDLTYRLAALLHDIGKPFAKSIDKDGILHFFGNSMYPSHEIVSAEIAEKILKRLRYSNEVIDEVIYLIRYHMINWEGKISDKLLRKRLNKHGKKLKQLVMFNCYDSKGRGFYQEYEEIESRTVDLLVRIDRIIADDVPVSTFSLKVDGNDIMRILEIPSGKKVGEIKQLLMDLVLEDPEMNKREILEEKIKEFKGGIKK